MSKVAPPTARRVYSYIRFSTPEQAMGDSERRQLADARQWSARNGFRLDETGQLADRGLSGFHGTHRKKGALGRFLAAVERREIPRGSILLVENIDRLSREGAAKTLKEIIFKLWEYGITLQTLSPEESYEPGCDSNAKFLALFIYMQRAQDESAQKSHRKRRSNERKLEEARTAKRIVTSMCPWWLEVREGTFRVITRAKQTINRIFRLKAQGLSPHRIEKLLNGDAAWTPPPRRKADRATGMNGSGWRASYIKKILRNRAVIGEYQPFQSNGGVRRPIGEPIADYYPAIVPRDLFYKVHQQLAENLGKGGRTGKINNLFRHLVKCAYCGGSMALIDKRPRGSLGLVCDNGRRGVKCARHAIRYDEVETLILENCERLRPEDVLPCSHEHESEIKSIRERLAGYEAEKSDIDQQLDNLIVQIGRTKEQTLRDRYEARVQALQGRQQELKQSALHDSQLLHEATASRAKFSDWQRNVKTLRDALRQDAPELRLRLQTHLREMIARIDVYANGHVDEYDLETGAGDDFRQYFEAAVDAAGGTDLSAKDARLFASYVLKRRMSKEGRFVVVQFRGNSGRRGIPLSPPDSLADGYRMRRQADAEATWDLVRPDLARLIADFKRTQAKRC